MFEELLRQFPKDDVALAGRSSRRVTQRPEILRSFWEECGAGYFGGLALHVFGECYEEPFQDIEVWNTEVLTAFRWLVPSSYIAFAEDPFGTQFFYDQTLDVSPVYSLVLQDAMMYMIGASISEFFGSLLDERKRDAILNYQFYIDCLVNDINHNAGRHLTLKVPRCLGGDEALGLIDVEATTNMIYLGQLLEQAQNLPPEELASRIRFSAE